MWCSYHKTTTHNGVDCRARPANGLNGNALFAQVRPQSVRGIYSSWDLPVRDDSDEKPYIIFMAREVQPAAKPAKARVEGKGARPSDPVSTAATGGRRTRPWSFTPRAEPIISLGGPVAEETFGMANDEGPVGKALGASPWSPLHPRTASTVISPPLWWTAERQATTSTMPSSATTNTVYRTTCILLRPARFSLPGELCWTVRRKACCKALPPSTTATKSSFGSVLWWCPGLGATCFR